VSQSNIEIVHGFFEARNRGDQSYFDYLDPDAELDLLESRGPYRGLYRGHDEIRKHRESRDEAWATVEWHLEEPVAVGDHVVVTARASAQGRLSGVELAGHGANVFTLRGGKIIRLKLFQTRSEALASVGLAD
jgi:ketosteroid isomerase-like protein